VNHFDVLLHPDATTGEMMEVGNGGAPQLLPDADVPPATHELSFFAKALPRPTRFSTVNSVSGHFAAVPHIASSMFISSQHPL